MDADTQLVIAVIGEGDASGPTQVQLKNRQPNAARAQTLGPIVDAETDAVAIIVSVG